MRVVFAVAAMLSRLRCLPSFALWLPPEHFFCLQHQASDRLSRGTLGKLPLSVCEKYANANFHSILSAEFGHMKFGNFMFVCDFIYMTGHLHDYIKVLWYWQGPIPPAMEADIRTFFLSLL